MATGYRADRLPWRPEPAVGALATLGAIAPLRPVARRGSGRSGAPAVCGACGMTGRSSARPAPGGCDAVSHAAPWRGQSMAAVGVGDREGPASGSGSGHRTDGLRWCQLGARRRPRGRQLLQRGGALWGQCRAERDRAPGQDSYAGQPEAGEPEEEQHGHHPAGPGQRARPPAGWVSEDRGCRRRRLPAPQVNYRGHDPRSVTANSRNRDTLATGTCNCTSRRFTQPLKLQNPPRS
jgi:hypothetical protein